MSSEDEMERWEAQRLADLSRKAGLSHSEEEFEPSDEEVMAIENSDSDVPKADPEEGWGSRRGNYYGGADDQGEFSAQEDEEEEALRLQQKQIEELDEADFFDEDDADGWKKQVKEDVVEDIALPQHDPASMDSVDRLNFLKESYPEVLLLSKEIAKCRDAEKKLEDETGELADIKKTALGSYMAMIYSYYALFSAQAREGIVDLKEHPVMEGILKARELWRLAQRLGEAEDPEEDEEVSSEGELLDPHEPIEVSESEQEGQLLDDEQESVGGSSSGGLEDSDSDEASEEEDEEEAEEEDDFSIPYPAAKKARKTVRVEDYDETADTVEQQARAKSKQSLRFYTSQIDKRNAARNDPFGGDIDLPYKERAFERRKRLLEEARQRGQEEKDKLGEESEDEAGAHNEFYEKVKQEKMQKKQARRELHESAKQAAKQGRLDQYLQENPTVDKRAINYQIQKNRGLTPKRKKENRNARVKKRVRYADAQKRLKGVRRVYKEPTGPYRGEETGIRKNVVHSKKF